MSDDIGSSGEGDGGEDGGVIGDGKSGGMGISGMGDGGGGGRGGESLHLGPQSPQSVPKSQAGGIPGKA